MIKNSSSQDPQQNAVIMMEKASLRLIFHLREMGKVENFILVIHSFFLHRTRPSKQVYPHLSEKVYLAN